MGCGDSARGTYPDLVEDDACAPRVACALSKIIAVKNAELVRIIKSSNIDWKQQGITCDRAIKWLREHRNNDRRHMKQIA